jgi:hypothetical protein
MNKLFISISLIFLFPLLGSGSKLPDDILNSNCLLGIQCPDASFVDFSASALNEMKSLGFKIEYCYHINENPTLRKKRLENCKQEIKEKHYSFKYLINITVVFNGLSGDYVYVLIISKPNEIELLPSDYCYMTRSSSLKKIFLTLHKKLKK